MKRADTVTAVGFLLFLAAMLATVLLHFTELRDTLLTVWRSTEPVGEASLLDKAANTAQHSDDALNQVLDVDHTFIQLFGGAQRLIGRRYVADMVPTNSVVKLSSGSLNFLDLTATSWPDPTGNAERTAALSRWLAARDIPLLTVVAPQKIGSSDELPVGAREFGNQTGDTFLAALTAAGGESLDLRTAFAQREDRSSLFFRTDHHWRPEGAFFAYQLLADKMEQRYGFVTDPRFTDLSSYSVERLPDFFLGSQGKRVGSLYAGTDDFSVITPNFDTSFTYSADWIGTRTGSFSQALCFPERIEQQDWFGGNPYVYYSGGDYGRAVMVNHLNPNGPKVVLIRESFSCALAPFLTLSCSELVTVDLRYLDRPLTQLLEEESPDLVMLLYCTSSFRLSNLFEFGPIE